MVTVTGSASGARSERSERRGPDGSVGVAVESEIPQVVKKRRHSNAYRLRILREADHCGRGELGALLRREGLYHSTIIKWRSWRDKMDDITPESSKKKNPEADLRKEFQKLQAENLRLKLRIQRVEGLLDLQKKAFELLGEMNRDDHKSEKN
jgi:transposase